MPIPSEKIEGFHDQLAKHIFIVHEQLKHKSHMKENSFSTTASIKHK
jgi:hypothetical protein